MIRFTKLGPTFNFHCLLGVTLQILQTITSVADAANCSSVTDPNGLSVQCSSLSLSGDDKALNFFPTGEVVSFNITALIKECAGLTCYTSNQKCNVTQCPCCVGYTGADPGFTATIAAKANAITPEYVQFLNCSFPPYVANPQGFYYFQCSFTGRALASTVKMVTMQLSWMNMPLGGAINFDLYISAGNLSLPDSQWNWERGDSFPLNQYGMFIIHLYDAYGNRLSASTGAERPNVQIDATFQTSACTLPGSNASEAVSDTTPTIKVTWQMAYGLCIISVYAKSEGKFSMTVHDEHNFTLPNMPSTFTVTPDESNKYKPPTDPEKYFLGDKYEASLAVVCTTLNLWLIMLMLLSTNLVTVLEIPSELRFSAPHP